MSTQNEEKEYEEVKLQKSQQVSELLESRHILDEEIKMVIYNAETRGEKLYQLQTERFLAKRRIADVTFCVEYSPASGKTYVVQTAYSHRTKLQE